MPAAKLDKARAKTSMTKAVAAAVMPERARAVPRRQTRRGLWWSGVAEVALLELLARDDFDAVIERYGACAQRSPAPD